jgi:hypothetical protein
MDTEEADGRSLQASAAYCFGVAYCASLRTALARSAPRDPVCGQALHYRELIAREASGLMRERLEELGQSPAEAASRASGADHVTS